MEKSSSNFKRSKIPKGCDLAGRGDIAAHRLGDPAEIQPRLNVTNESNQAYPGMDLMPLSTTDE